MTDGSEVDLCVDRCLVLGHVGASCSVSLLNERKP